MVTTMEKIKIAVLVSGGGTNLQALLDAEKSGILFSGEIVKVISNKADAYALTRAKENHVPTSVLLKKDFESQKDFEQALQKELENCQAELIVLAGFMSILSEDFTCRWVRRILNVHPALIPSFCGKGMYGLYPHIAALKKGVKVTGATVHFVNEIPDGGEIVAQKAVEVLEGDTPEILQKRVMEQAEWIILPQSVEKVSAEMLLSKKRNEKK
jgi:phosphoribosylglycinamide formyltransferase-1